jgi:hypothetical protein
MNVEIPRWVAPRVRHDAPIGNALRRLYYAHDPHLPEEFEALLRRLGSACCSKRIKRGNPVA